MVMTTAEPNILRELGKLDRQWYLTHAEYLPPAKAREIAAQMLTLANENLPSDHPMIAQCAMKLAGEMHADKEHEPAIALQERAVAIYRAASGAFDDATVAAEFSLAEAF